MAKINSRNKGAKTERFVAKLLEEWTGKEFSRTPSSGGLQWHNRKGITGDIVCTTEGHYFPFSVEIKNHKEINFQHPLYLDKAKLDEFWSQANNDAIRANKQPLLMVRYNGMPKELYFLCISLEFYDKLPAKYKKTLSYLIIINPRTRIIIFKSSEFFNTFPYRKLKKIIKAL